MTGKGNFDSRQLNGGQVEELAPEHWRLSVPAGGREYRLAQLDDYMHLPRSRFRWKRPISLSIRARVSRNDIPGTWGFGFWNDPFSMSFGTRGAAFRLPALPNAAWYFYASPPNHLALRDHAAQGLLAASFAAPLIPPALLVPGALALPLLLFRPAARLLLRLARLPVKDDAALVEHDSTRWHEYALSVNGNEVTYIVDGKVMHVSTVTPLGPLGFVLWIDNQYAALRPDGRLGYGTLTSSQADWLEVMDVHMQGDQA